MKLMVISDLHGSASFCEKAIDAFKREKADKLLLLGDILYHGARNDLPVDYSTKKVAAMLNQIKDKILCVKGNCDSEVDAMVLEFPLSPDYILLELNGKTIMATHGHKVDGELKNIASNVDIVLSGHTHIALIEKIENTLYCNPGSMPIPKSEFAGYLILENGKISLKSIKGETVLEK